MTTTVSVTDFRDNISEYLDLLMRGYKVEVNDAKKGKKLVTLVAEKEEKFDWDKYLKFVDSLGGSGFLASSADEKTRKKFKDDINKRFAKAVNR